MLFLLFLVLLLLLQRCTRGSSHGSSSLLSACRHGVILLASVFTFDFQGFSAILGNFSANKTKWKRKTCVIPHIHIHIYIHIYMVKAN